MPKGMGFLNTKSWHPMTKQNIRKVWIAEQQAAEKAKREKERVLELEKERDLWQNRNMVGMSTSEAEKIKLQAPVAFMYQAPAIVLSAMKPEEKEDIQGPAPIEQERTEKEKLVDRFPFLKGAPSLGEYTDNVKVRHKPFGKEVRNVRCIRCGEWGHQAGERVCRLVHEPNPADCVNKDLLDPLRAIQILSASQGTELSSYDNKGAKLAFKHAGLSPIRGGGSKDDVNQQIISEEKDLSQFDRERAFLDSLTEEEKQLVFEQLLKEKKEKKARRKEKKKAKALARKEKKHKHSKHKKRHRKSSSSSSSSSDSESDSEVSSSSDSDSDSSDEEEQRRKRRKKHQEKKSRH